MQACAAMGSLRLTTPLARQSCAAMRCFSSEVAVVEPEDMPYLHHGRRPRHRDYKKFKSPRKRASTLFEELNKEAVVKSKEANPVIWDEGFRVGDSVEIKMVSQGGVNAKEADKQVQDVEKIRGVVLGMVKRGLSSSVILRDVVYGLPIERKIPMHSPMIKEAKVLERNFIFKGKKRVKRSKLYYFRDLNPLCKFITNASICLVLASARSSSHSLISIYSDQGLEVLALIRKNKTLLA
jgi:large subunit ribosomal protein L19